MSVFGLGDKARVGTLDAQTLDCKGSLTVEAGNIGMSAGHRLRVYEIQVPPTNTYTTADNGGTTAKRGLHLVSTTAGPGWTMNLPAGEFDGDILEFLHVAGGNTATFQGNLRAPAAQFQFSATAGGYIKLVWHTSAWYIVARSSDALAVGNAVDNLPIIS